ncbi:MAG: response regulator [Lachnospiraceae bacterium]|nr:response regulator [Lachnospiraceae bacterium]
MKKRTGLLNKFAIIFILFALITTITSAIFTYFIQMRTYRQLCWDTIKDVGDYLTNLILADGQDFVDYTEFFSEHYKDLRIPLDFEGYDDARNEFVTAYTREYPNQTLYSEKPVSELPYDMQLLYYTFRQEYWLTTFEQARESFNLPYTYFLTLNEADHTCTYQIDGERIEDSDHPGYLYMGDTYYEDPKSHTLLWNTYINGQKYDDVYEWDNEWGNCYSYYTPLIIDDKVIGLVVAEIDVADVNREILTNSVRLGARIAGIFFVGILLLLFIINGAYISKIHYLADKIERYAATRDHNTTRDLRSYNFRDDEIGMLAEQTADMISEIEEHEEEINRAAQMKTDFLANMSHEIRTPMNAVIGMAEMALREDVSDTARNYIGQIKASGRILIAIINDILDFSKIESGNMEIIPTDYIPTSMFNDVSNIVMMRIGSKEIALDVDLPPDLPAMLNGDNIRIRQILINLANNAVKFTECGKVSIIVTYSKKDDNNILLKVAVSDTGIGIKPQDLTKIFESFSQVDSKRNRSVEGTGLGLAISQRLVDLMGGTLDVTSEYGKGSTFTFTIPQTVIDWTPGMKVKEPDKCTGLALFRDTSLTDSFKRDSCRLGVTSIIMDSKTDLGPKFNEVSYQNPKSQLFFFTDEASLTPDRISCLESHPEVICVIITDFTGRCDITVPNMVQVKRPISSMTLSLIYNREKVYFDAGQSDDISSFTAPGAHILLVDDNPINLAVAEGLLEPLKMSVMSAVSGQEAIDLASRHRFDIIFMDHMMPEMDGVEATHIIREKYPEYNNIPIIALTANAIGDARDMFLKEGLDDFVPKPIEVRNLTSKVKQWLPPEKIKMMTAAEILERKENDRVNNTASRSVVIGDLDTDTAISMIGSEKVFRNILKEYHRVLSTKAEAIRSHYEAKDWPAYTIEVHALKSSSRQIGAMELADMAAELEKAGKELNIDYIEAHTDELLERYESYKPVLDTLFSDEAYSDNDKPLIDNTVLTDIWDRLRSGAENLDLDVMEAAAEELDKYSYPAGQEGFAQRIKEAVGSIDTDSCLEIMEAWKKATEHI